MGSARRLSVVDEIFLRTHRGLGTPIALQGLWRTADRVDPELLRQVHAALRVGPLGRRVIRPRVPGARRGWRANTRAYPLAFTDRTIATGDLLEWADEQGANLDPEYGPGWRLSTAALADGGSIVSLTCSHALADGRALVLAVDDALGGPSLTTPPARVRRSFAKSAASEATCSRSTQMAAAARGASSTSEPKTSPAPETTSATSEPSRGNDHPDSTTRHAAGSAPTIDNVPGGCDAGESMAVPKPPGSPSTVGEVHRAYARVNASLGRDLTSDWSDAWRQWSIVVRGTVRALRRGIPERPARGRSARPDAGPPIRISDPPAWSSTPAATGAHLGSSVPNRAHPGKTTPTHGVVLQCAAAEWESVAAAQGGTANSLFIALVAKMLWASGFPGETIDASLPVDTRDEPRVDNDLAMTEVTIDRADTAATIREKARIAYERRMSSPGGMPEELLQVIPDRLAYALSKGAGERDILCSNIGTLPDSLRTLGPHRCTGVAARAIHPGLTANRLPRTRLAAYLCRIAETYTLAVVSLEPDRVGTSETLRALAHETATALDLPIALW